MSKVRLIENFLSFQGEGKDVGQPMIILRFKRCSRVSAGTPCPFCDTLVKMRISNEADYALRDIQNIVDEHNCGLLITGGEPTFNLNLNQTISLINGVNAPIYNVETNGCNLVGLIKKVDPVKKVRFILSPKIFTNEDLGFYMKLSKEIMNDERVYIKLVCEDKELIYEYLDFLKVLNFPNLRVYLMPQGKTRDELIGNSEVVLDMAEKYNFCISDRMHIVYNFT